MWQNVTDAFLLQETIIERGIDLVIECGNQIEAAARTTWHDLRSSGGKGHVVTIDHESIVDFQPSRINVPNGKLD